jgi:hypothetical protein
MVDWQITAATIYCDDVDDEVTVIVNRDGSVRCVRKQLKRQLKCNGPECSLVTDYRDRLFAEETNRADSTGTSEENGPGKQRK